MILENAFGRRAYMLQMAECMMAHVPPQRSRQMTLLTFDEKLAEFGDLGITARVVPRSA